MSRGLLGPLLCASLAAAATLLAARPRPRVPTAISERDRHAGAGPGAGRRGTAARVALALLAGAGALLLVGGPVGTVAGPVVGLGCWRVLSRAEPAAVRRARLMAARDLPHLVGLMAAGLRSGAPPAGALAAACAALPGPAADAFQGARARLALGMDPVLVWEELAGEPGVAVLGRCLARAHQTGAPVGASVEALAGQLAQEGLAEAEDRARAVGVWAALPLGLCLLPAFLLLGIVPVVAGLAAQLVDR